MVAVVRLQFRLPWQPRQLICRSPDWGLWFELQRRCLRLGLSRTGWFELSCECIESSPLAHWKWAHFASQPDVMGWAGRRATEPFEYKYCVYNRTVFLCHWTIMTGLWQKSKKKRTIMTGPVALQREWKLYFWWKDKSSICERFLLAIQPRDCHVGISRPRA